MRKLKEGRWVTKVRKCKLRGRAELKLEDWWRFDFATHDFWIEPGKDTLSRIRYEDVGEHQFTERYQIPGVPVMVTGVTTHWPARERWQPEALLRDYADQRFKVGKDDDGGNVYMKLKHFMRYVADGADRDDSPLYIFDSNFAGPGRRSSGGQRRELQPTSPVARPVDDPRRTDSGELPPSKRAKIPSPGVTGHSSAPTQTDPVNAPLAATCTTEVTPGDSGAEIDGSDSDVAQRAKADLLGDYKIPKYFRQDIFKLAGSRRPPHRWFVAGPARSGTGIHFDPLGTSAWNTVVVGHKRWALFPPRTPRPLVDPPSMKPYDREAASWFYQVHPQFHKPPTAAFFQVYGPWYGYPCPDDVAARSLASRFRRKTLGELIGMVEVIHGPGETIFVPGGWLHVVINLNFTVAITHNLCAPASFEYVWLKTRYARPGLSDKIRREIESRKCLAPSITALGEGRGEGEGEVEGKHVQAAVANRYAKTIFDYVPGSPAMYRLLADSMVQLTTVPTLFTSSDSPSSSPSSNSSSTPASAPEDGDRLVLFTTCQAKSDSANGPSSASGQLPRSSADCTCERCVSWQAKIAKAATSASA
ncbi:hypothetical protein IWQ60_002261 [Tieghemiomyces parasiticus]|uniref:JmjC domain-containing protein n=1 Tax=Tieghemiomyces parasiticus TaxID=78921 RepID=A0A9W8AFI2_9FUNG|nr:hypothetical protein IWQ60_002261 [Tieghemiomyces parasiticus]